MSWVKVDDQFADHPKFVGLSDAALALWLRALAYANRHLTDGRVPVAALCALSRHKKPSVVAQELVDARLWVQLDRDFEIHDYLGWNDSSEQAKAKREAKLEAKRAAGRKGGLASGVARSAKQTPSTDEPETKQRASSMVDGCLKQNEAKRTSDSDSDSDSEISSETIESLLPPVAPPPTTTTTTNEAILTELRRHPKLACIADRDTAASLVVYVQAGGTRIEDVFSSLRAVAFDLETGANEATVRKAVRSYVSRAKQYGDRDRSRQRVDVEPDADLEAAKLAARLAAKARLAGAPT